MRYVRLTQAPRALPGGIAQPALHGVLIAPAGGPQTLAARQRCTDPTVALAPVAAPANHLLDQTATTLKQTGRRLHRQTSADACCPPNPTARYCSRPRSPRGERGIGRDLAVSPDAARPLARRPIYAEIPDAEQSPAVALARTHTGCLLHAEAVVRRERSSQLRLLAE